MVSAMAAGTAAQLHTPLVIHQIVYRKLVHFPVYKLHPDEVTEQGKKRRPGFRCQLCQAILSLRIYLRTEPGPPGQQSPSRLVRKGWLGARCDLARPLTQLLRVPPDMRPASPGWVWGLPALLSASPDTEQKLDHRHGRVHSPSWGPPVITHGSFVPQVWTLPPRGGRANG